MSTSNDYPEKPLLQTVEPLQTVVYVRDVEWWPKLTMLGPESEAKLAEMVAAKRFRVVYRCDGSKPRTSRWSAALDGVGHVDGGRSFTSARDDMIAIIGRACAELSPQLTKIAGEDYPCAHQIAYFLGLEGVKLEHVIRTRDPMLQRATRARAVLERKRAEFEQARAEAREAAWALASASLDAQLRPMYPWELRAELKSLASDLAGLLGLRAGEHDELERQLEDRVEQRRKEQQRPAKPSRKRPAR